MIIHCQLHAHYHYLMVSDGGTWQHFGKPGGTINCVEHLLDYSKKIWWASLFCVLGICWSIGNSVLRNISEKRHKCWAGFYDNGCRDKKQNGTTNSCGNSAICTNQQQHPCAVTEGRVLLTNLDSFMTSYWSIIIAQNVKQYCGTQP